ncbi:unnamed protein product [Closterium sp. NIES-53]
MFTRRPGSGLYTLTTEFALVAESGQVTASVEVAASCSCRLLAHQTLLWHHRLGHPSLPCLRGMHSRLLVSGLPRSLPPLPRSHAPPCLPCVEGRQHASPHSSFPPTTAPPQTLHMDVWGPARVPGHGGESYFLLVVDDYMRYTTAFPLQSKAEVRSVLICWIRAVSRLSARFQQDLLVLRLHSDRGSEFSSDLLEEFCGAEGIRQTFTLPASPQQNGIAERRIGLVMEVAHTSIVHAAAPHFLWPFAVRYAAEQLNLWPRVSHSETSPTLRWTGEVGDASPFRVWGAVSLVRNPPTGKLSPRTLRCVFFGFPTNAPGWQFYHPGSRRVLSSQDVTFDESDCFYRLHPHRSSLMPLPPLALVDPSPLVEPVEVSSDTSGPAEGGDPTLAAIETPRRSARLAVPPGFPPRPSSPPLQPVVVDTGAAGGGTTGGASSGGAECPLGTGGTGGIGVGGPGMSRQDALSPERLREWAVQWGSPGGGASRTRTTRAGGAGTPGAAGGAAAVGVAAGSPGGGTGRAGAAGSGGAGPGGASAGVPGTGDIGAVGGTGGTGAAGGPGGAGPGGASTGGPGIDCAGGTGTGGGADTGGTPGGTGVSGASRQESLSPLQLREWAVRWGTSGGGAGGTGLGGAVATGAGGSGVATTQPQASALCHLLSLPRAATEFLVAGTTPPLLFPPADQSQPQLLPGSPLPALAPHNEVTASLTARRELETCDSILERREPETKASVPACVRRPCAPAVPDTHDMTLRPSSVPLRVVLPSPPASSLPHVPDPKSDLVRAAIPTVTRLLATVVTDRSFEFAAASTLVVELVDFAALCRLDYAASLVFESSCPPSVGGELALGCDVLEDRKFELECLAPAAPHLASTLLCPEGDPDALDISTPRTYAEAITGTYVDELPPPGTNIVDCMWIFRMKRPSGSPPAFKARYRDYELHSLDFSTAFLQCSLHEAIWLRRPRGFTGSCPEGTQWSLRGPFYSLRHAPREWHDTLRITLSALGFAPSTAHPSLRSSMRDTLALSWVIQHFDFTWSSPQPTPLSSGHSLSAPPSEESVEPSGPYPELVGCLMYLMTCTRPDLAYPLNLLARYVALGRHRKLHWEAAKRVLRYLCNTSGMGLVLEGPGSVVLTDDSDASWADDQTTYRSTQGCEAEICAGAMAAQELRWLTYLLTDLGEQPRSPPVLYVDNKAMIYLCHEQRLEHRTKHIALRYFLTWDLQQRGQLHLAYVATQANTADVFTKALGSSDHQRFCTALGLVPTLSHLLVS